MNYDTSNPIQLKRAQMRFKTLCDAGKVLALTERKKPRTVRANAYMHVCITLWAIEYGYTIEEAKTHLKRNCPGMTYEKGGEMFLKRTRDMDTAELAKFIDWIRNYAGAQGLYIPDADEYKAMKWEIDNEIQRHSEYL